MRTNRTYSVLISVYNKEKADYLLESVTSMLNQSVKPDEIIIVEDGILTEQLSSVLNKLTQSEPNIIKTIKLSENVGLGIALNEGLVKCRNELVARMDSDDISLPIRCELQLNEFDRDPNLSIVGSWTNEFRGDTSHVQTSRVVPTSYKDIIKFSKRRSPFNHPTVMYRKSDVLKFHGYSDIKRNEDVDLFLRMLIGGCRAINIPKPLLYYRINDNNYLKRKSWINCKNYIVVYYYSWKSGHSGFIDLLLVMLFQTLFVVLPLSVIMIISDNLLRKKIDNKYPNG